MIEAQQGKTASIQPDKELVGRWKICSSCLYFIAPLLLPTYNFDCSLVSSTALLILLLFLPPPPRPLQDGEHVRPVRHGRPGSQCLQTGGGRGEEEKPEEVKTGQTTTLGPKLKLVELQLLLVDTKECLR